MRTVLERFGSIIGGRQGAFRVVVVALLTCCVKVSHLLFTVVLEEYWRGFGAKHVGAAPTILFVSSLLMVCRCSRMKRNGASSTTNLMHVDLSETVHSLR